MKKGTKVKAWVVVATEPETELEYVLHCSTYGKHGKFHLGTDAKSNAKKESVKTKAGQILSATVIID